MRLLFLTPYVPSPPSSGGAMRMHGLISNLAERHEIAILAFKEQRSEVTESVEATGQYARLIVTVKNPHVGVLAGAKRRGQLRSLFSRRSYEHRTHSLLSYQRALDRVSAEWRPDVIVVEFAQMGFVDFPPGIPVVLDAHNLEHEIIERTAQVERSLSRRIYSRINARKLQREELELVGRVDGLSVTSERDGRSFERLVVGVRPVVVPNGVDCERFKPSEFEPGDPTLLFFGALDYYPNVDAVLDFHSQCWPQLKAMYPNLKFNIVGRKPPSAIRSLADEPGVDVTGLVDDVRQWIAGASVVVVPLRAGSGTRLKVLEAMAMARPVVASSLAVEGLEVEAGEHLLIADMPAEFVHSVCTLIDSPEACQRIGKAGRRLAEAIYDWRGVSREFEDLLLTVVTSRTAK